MNDKGMSSNSDTSSDYELDLIEIKWGVNQYFK